MSTEQRRWLPRPTDPGGCSVHSTLDVEGRANSPGTPLWRQEATQMNLTLMTSLPPQGGRLLLARRPHAALGARRESGLRQGSASSPTGHRTSEP